jgi:hypothetical protein
MLPLVAAGYIDFRTWLPEPDCNAVGRRREGVMEHSLRAGSAASERLARFQERPDIQRVTARYAEWAESEDGCVVNVQLAGLAMLRLAGRITRQDYKRSVRRLAKSTGLPVHDFLLIAKCSLEAAQCVLVGSRQIPFMPDRWDAEAAEA